MSNSEIHGINKRFNCDLHPTSTTLTLFQKGTFYSGSRFVYHLPPNIKDLINEKLFKSALKKYLLENILIKMLMILVFNIICKLIT